MQKVKVSQARNIRYRAAGVWFTDICVMECELRKELEGER